MGWKASKADETQQWQSDGKYTEEKKEKRMKMKEEAYMSFGVIPNQLFR